ncbi:hypothetical protein EJ02DRAFT_514052 [Clathrospora elynae]|uniref:Uncharacterized protein n=1 Tax=Clathrospora elynae TaxID=706981 RepID=A0A6A5SGJ1_9PLEO|nr:hypothetical protein EJ02DRAFT_514052 [Clathrospora elynae]
MPIIMNPILRAKLCDNMVAMMCVSAGNPGMTACSAKRNRDVVGIPGAENRWHIDAPFYARDPAWFTTLRCIKRPRAPKLTINWDDGSGLTMKTEPGLTAFFSNVQTYSLMTVEEKKIADHSWIECAPHPYQWMGNCKGRSNGLGVERVLNPECIMLPKVEEGDVILWANYQVFHTAVDYPDQWGARTMHQANIGASLGPVGPVGIPVFG